MRNFRTEIDIDAPADRVWDVMSDVERWSRATLSLDLHGPLGGVLGWLTGAITERHIGFEARGLKARSETR